MPNANFARVRLHAPIDPHSKAVQLIGLIAKGNPAGFQQALIDVSARHLQLVRGQEVADLRPDLSRLHVHQNPLFRAQALDFDPLDQGVRGQPPWPGTSNRSVSSTKAKSSSVNGGIT